MTLAQNQLAITSAIGAIDSIRASMFEPPSVLTTPLALVNEEIVAA